MLKLEKDEHLVALIRSGHDRAFEVLWDRYNSRLLAFCSSMLKSRQDAEDVLQEVFVNAHKAMLADDRKINVRPWLYRIARNRCLNHLRRPVPEGQDSMDIHPHMHGTTTAEHVQKREELRQVLQDVDTLPETQKTALLLREIDQMSYDEIAVAMETTIPAVKSLLVRARITLAESSESRTLSCDEVRLSLAEAAEGIAKASGPVRLHVKNCEGCSAFRDQLRSDRKALAALFPIGPLAMLKAGFFAKLFGGGSSAAAGSGGAAGGSGAIGAAAAGSGATAGGIGAIGGAIGTKAAAGVATAALLTAGAVEVKQVATRAPAAPAPIERALGSAAHPLPAPAAGNDRKLTKRVTPALAAHSGPADAAAAAEKESAPVERAAANPGEDPAPADEPAAAPAEQPATGEPGAVAEDEASAGDSGASSGAGRPDGSNGGSGTVDGEIGEPVSPSTPASPTSPEPSGGTPPAGHTPAPPAPPAGDPAPGSGYSGGAPGAGS